MSGHSRWAGIKHKKAAIDSKRGKVFTRIIREITIAAKMSGGNPDSNPRLRKAMLDAHEANMPQDNIKKAILRGTGELPGVIYEELVYEGYGPKGVALIVELTTDNRNRTSSEIRKIFANHGGNMGESGSVAWMFSSKGLLVVDKKQKSEDEILGIALDAGAEDMSTSSDDVYEITTQPGEFEKVKEALVKAGVTFVSAEVTLVPQTYIPLTGKEAEQMLSLMNDLENHDDVKNVHSNFDIPKEELAKLEAQG